MSENKKLEDIRNAREWTPEMAEAYADEATKPAFGDDDHHEDSIDFYELVASLDNGEPVPLPVGALKTILMAEGVAERPWAHTVGVRMRGEQVVIPYITPRGTESSGGIVLSREDAAALSDMLRNYATWPAGSLKPFVWADTVEGMAAQVGFAEAEAGGTGSRDTRRGEGIDLAFDDITTMNRRARQMVTEIRKALGGTTGDSR